MAPDNLYQETVCVLGVGLTYGLDCVDAKTADWGEEGKGNGSSALGDG